jgi:hypothetical protein
MWLQVLCASFLALRAAVICLVDARPFRAPDPTGKASWAFMWVVWPQAVAGSSRLGSIVVGVPAGRRRVGRRNEAKLAFSHASTLVSAHGASCRALTRSSPCSNQQWSAPCQRRLETRTASGKQTRCAGIVAHCSGGLQHGRQQSEQGSGQACTSAPAQIEGRSEPDTQPEVPHDIYVQPKPCEESCLMCVRRTGRGAVVAITKRVALLLHPESALPGTYAAIAVVILASVCHVRPRALSWREGP